MSLFHSTPVTVQRTYYKPSAMARLKALFTPRHRRTTAVPIATRRRRAAPVRRQPIRKSGGLGLFRRSPRRTVVATQRHRGFFASLRPRRHVYGRSRRHVATTAVPRHRHHGSSGKGRTFATILAAFSLRKHRRRGHYGHGGFAGYGSRPRY